MSTLAMMMARLDLLAKLCGRYDAVIIDYCGSPVMDRLERHSIRIHHVWARSYREDARPEHLRRSSASNTQSYEDLVMGAIDVNLVIGRRAIATPCEYATEGASAIKIRTLDSAFCKLQCVALLGLFDSTDVVSQLRGAAQLIQRHRPVIAFGSLVQAAISEKDWQAIDEILLAAGYIIFDLKGRSGSALTPTARLSDAESITERVFIAVPKGSRAGRIFYSDACKSSPLWADFVRSGWLVDAEPNRTWPRTGGICEANMNASLPAVSEPFDIPATWSVSVKFDEHLRGFGWWGAETNGTDYWRWSGPGNVFNVRIPIPLPGTYKVEFLIMNESINGLVNRSRIFANSVELDISEVGGGVTEEWKILHRSSVFTVRADEFRGWIDFDFVTPESAKTSSHDGRRLGLCMNKINLTLDS